MAVAAFSSFILQTSYGAGVEAPAQTRPAFRLSQQTSPRNKVSFRRTLKENSGLKAVGGQCASSDFWGGESYKWLEAAVTTRTKTHPNSSCRHGPVKVVAYKVSVLGAAGGIGQPLSLLLKMSPLLSNLNLYDIANVKGVATDLSHCNTPAQVTGFTGPDELADSLKDVDLIIIPAGVPRKPGMTRDDLFNINAGIVKNLVEKLSAFLL